MHWNSRRTARVAAPIVAAVALALSIHRVPNGAAVAVRWLWADSAAVATGGTFFAPPLLTSHERLGLRGNRPVLAGSLPASSREGVGVTASWQATISGQRVPAVSAGVAASLAEAVARAIDQTLASASATDLARAPSIDLLPVVTRTSPPWGAVLAELTCRVELPEAARAADELASLRAGLVAQPGPVLLVAWDGADWELLDELLAAGELPSLAGLVRTGVSAELSTLRPMISPLIWTSVVTGVGPDVHGILDFLRPVREGSGTEPITAFDRRVPALWNIASALGRRVGVVAWWASWPAEPVDGFVVSDRVAYQLSGYDAGRQQEALVYPPAAATLFMPLRRLESDVSEVELSRYITLEPGSLSRALAAGHGYEDPVVHLARVIASTDTYHRMTLAGLQRFRPDLLLTYVEGTDTIGHLFGPYHPPRRPFIAEGDFQRYQLAVTAYYKHADRLLGELLAAVGAEATVIVCSDHGFTWGEARPREASGTHTPTAAWWHRDPGVLVMAGPRIRQVAGRGKAHVLDLAPTIARLMGLPPGSAWTGKPLTWAIEPEDPREEPVSADYARLVPPPALSITASPQAQDEEYVARLRALGYIAGSSESASGGPQPTPAETLTSVMNRGTALLDAGDLAGAVAAYRHATELDPNSSAAWSKLGTAQRRAGDLSAALGSYQTATRAAKTPLQAESAFLGAAIALAELGRGDEAIALLRQGVRNLPDSFTLWNTLGGLLSERKDYPPAREALRRAVALQEEPAALNTLAALEIRVGNDVAAARRLLRRSLELRSDQPEARRFLGSLPQ